MEDRTIERQTPHSCLSPTLLLRESESLETVVRMKENARLDRLNPVAFVDRSDELPGLAIVDTADAVPDRR